MAGVLNGFAVIVVLVALGWILARTGVLGHDARLVLNRLVFFVATPALLLDSLARTTLDQVFNAVFVVSAGSAIVIAVAYVVIARLWLRRPAADLAIGALSAGYVNSANLGIPIALYVLGDLGFVMPLLLFQVVVMQPAAIAVLERAARAEGDQQPHGGGALGALLVFGMSLYGVKVLEAGISPRREIGLASALKLIAHPVLAFAMGAGLLGMAGHDLLTVVVAAALPTAQNVLVVATRYGHGTLLARDSAVITTLGALPVLLLVSALLA